MVTFFFFTLRGIGGAFFGFEGGLEKCLPVMESNLTVHECCEEKWLFSFFFFTSILVLFAKKRVLYFLWMFVEFANRA